MMIESRNAICRGDEILSTSARKISRNSSALGDAVFTGAVLLFGAAMAQASQSAKHEAEELRRVKLSLIEAVIAAEKESGGKATSAEFEFKRGNPAYFEVKVLSADGKKLTRYDLDPRTGKVQ